MRGKLLCSLAIVLLASGGPLLGGGDKDAGEEVLKKIQGTWKFVSHVMDGKEAPKDELAKMTITFKGDKWTVHEGDKVVQAGSHKFDPTKKPGQVDAKVTEGEGKGNTMLGIYEMKENQIKVSFDPKGKERPTDFTPKAGHFVVVVQREKKK